MIHSDTLSHSDITAALGLEPTWTADGEHVTWVLDQPGEDEQYDDATGSLCLEKLVARLEGLAQNLAQLREACDTTIRWFGTSNSEQGGFELPAQLVAGLGVLGCDLVGTVYFDGVPLEH